MKDFDIDNTIENANCEKKEQIRIQLYTRIGLPQQQESQTKSRSRGLRLRVAFGVVGLCVVCLAIVLPISLRSNTPPLPSQTRYSYIAADFADGNLGLTVREYAEQTGKKILYIDWYDIADECVTTKYYLPDREENIIYISEDLYSGETGDHIWLAVVETNISIDELDIARDFCIMSYEYNSTAINWAYNTNVARAYFECDGYKYYIRLDYPTSEQEILDIVKDML